MCDPSGAPYIKYLGWSSWASHLTVAWNYQELNKAILFYFLHLTSSDRPKFLAFSKKKSNDLVKPFFTWNNSFNLKNEHSNSIEKNRNKNRNIFYHYVIVHFVNPNM